LSLARELSRTPEVALAVEQRVTRPRNLRCGFAVKAASPTIFAAATGPETMKMKLQVLVTGAAILALAAGAADAATHSKHHAKGGGASLSKYAPPAQPIAYTKLDAYMKASPKERARGDWSNNTAQAATAATGAAANTSASTPPAAPQTPPAAAESAPAAPAAGAQAAPPAQPPPDQGAAAPGAATPPATPDTTQAPPPASSKPPSSPQ
jgi:hypothetical protein